VPLPVGHKKKESGFTLITAGLMSVGLIGITGIGVDLGRMYIAKNEAQAFADAAALTAAQYLDGTATGLANARTAAGQVGDRWNLNTKSATDYTVDFSPYSATNNFTWVANPNPATNYSVARVVARVQLPPTFIRVVWPNSKAPISATAVGAQAPKTSWKQGVFPFSPFAHLFDLKPHNCDNTGSLGSRDCTSGLIVGEQYTLRWPSNPNAGSGKSGGGSNMCPGDSVSGQTIIDIANAAGGSERGFIEDTSASLIAQTIIDD
jgi:Flp pilus assembly protein TadG